MSLIRLDKFLTDCLCGSRREVTADLKRGLCTVDGAVVKKGDAKVDTAAKVVFKGNPLVYSEFHYLMVSKPAGYLTATDDPKRPTVLDLLPDRYKNIGLGPIGRLDLDVTGLVLLTNDGPLVHRLISPKAHVPKVYVAKVEGALTDEHARLFRAGIGLSDFRALPAELSFEGDTGRLTIYEGKFHQVKRMFAAVGRPVLALERVSIAGVALDPALPSGAFRPLTGAELALLRSAADGRPNE